MSRAFVTAMGDRGQVVIPAEWCGRVGLTEGAPIVMLTLDDGILVLTREQLKRLVRRDLAGVDLVADLLVDRRSASADDQADN